MTSTRQVVSTVRTRAWHDIDPKVAAGAAIAALATLVLGTLLLAGKISAVEFSTSFGIAWGVVSASYFKRSSDTEPDPIQVAADVVSVIAPVVKDAVPAAEPAVEQVEDAVDLIRAAVDPRPPATEGGPTA